VARTEIGDGSPIDRSGEMSERRIPRDYRLIRGGPEQSDAEKKLVELFQNRAKLKKQYEELQAEHEALQERLKDVSDAAENSGDLSTAVSEYMGDPVNGMNVVVLCQLRKLWNSAFDDLSSLREDLVSKQTSAEEKKHMEAVRQQQGTKIAAIDRSVQAISSEAKAEARNLEVLLKTLAELTGFWNYFSRERVKARIGPQQAKVDEVNKRLEEIRAKREEAASESGLEFQGISVKGKRMINVALLARAQQLYIYFMDNDLASMAHGSRDKLATEAAYGNGEQVKLLSTQIEQRIAGMDHAKLLSRDLLKERVQGLRQSAEYKTEDQSFPDSSSVDYITRDARSNTSLTDRAPIPANVLEKDMWDLSQLLLK
jgi:hypothetical protein